MIEDFQIRVPVEGRVRSAPDVTVVIGTFGDTAWANRGRAGLRHTEAFQTAKPAVRWIHATTLAEARNYGGMSALTKWVVFLDADDMLHHDFCRVLQNYDGDADVLQTSVRGFNTGVGFIEEYPVFLPPKFSLLKQNYLIVGSPVRTELFAKVRGFTDLPVLEDWDLWLRCEKQGATFGELPAAVYQINDNHSRNKHPDIDAVAREIRAKYQ